IQLPQFDVSGKPEDRYRPSETLSVNRVAGSILESPFSVNAIPRELIEDLGANAVFDVTRYFSGMSPGRGTGSGGIQDRQNFRGFESLSKTIDNFSSFLLPTGSGFQANFDPAFIERVELVMGPNSVLSPTGSPGGSVNIITKSPKYNRASSITAEIGNYNAQKLTVDTTGPLGDGKHWAYRAIGSVQDTRLFTPGRLKQYNGSVQLQYTFSPTAKVTIKYFGEQWGLYGAVTNTNDNGMMVYTPDTVGGATLSNKPQPGFVYNSWNGNADWSHRIDRINIGQAEFTLALGEHVNMRLAAQVLYDNQTQHGAFPRDTPAVTIDPATDQTIAVASINPSSVPIVGQYFHAMNREIQFQNDYAANFHPGPVSLQPVVGWASQVGRSNSYTLINNNQIDLPPANLLTGFYSPPVPPIGNYGFSNYIPETASLFQAYGVIRAGFYNDRVFLMGGVSRTYATVHDYSFKGVTVPGVGYFGAVPTVANYLQDFSFDNTGSALAPSQKHEHDTYLAGVLFKLMDNVSLYGSFSTNAGITANNPLWQSGKQYEFGLKAEYFNKRLSFTAAHFQISQSNISTPNPLFNTGQSNISVLLSNQTSHGEEFNLVGGLTRNLSVIASFTEMKLRDPLGRRVRNVPDSMANLLLNYHFTNGLLKNLSTFGGVVHLGNVAGETRSGVTALGVPQQPGYYIAPWTVLNVGASYDLKRYRFSLNIDNALDSKFWWQPASRISVSPYPGLTARFTTIVRF
ncbi:MAG TPA: TonB-dependent receptor, partial [Opitutaceae bacterium]|nr:TonB-dependent receptor [Opitutaceae bacterium]